MDPQETVRSERRGGLPLKGLAVEVVAGADTGKRKVAESERLTVGTAADNDLVLADPTVSRYHLELERRGDRVLVVDHGSTNGTWIGAASIRTGSIPPGTQLSLGSSTKIRVDEGKTVTIELHEEDRLGGLVGHSAPMRRLMAQISKIAKSDSAVLLIGESGTGKELIARAVHDEGKRAKKPFVTVDCGALAPSLVASELFGHEKGAFTGADRRHAGAFERADGGTVFLDEIGELPPALQATLLGALERQRFRRVGGSEEVAVDVRIVSATNRDLRAEVNKGTFRLDLYYRLAVVLLSIPPLRERVEDLPLLVTHFLREAGHDGSAEDLLSREAMDALERHHWPGNVRELRNLVEATLAIGELPAIESRSPAAAGGEPSLDLPYRDARRALLDGFEKRYLTHLLKKTGGNVSLAAREARMDRSYLIDLLRRHDVK